ncbi:MULTISPECIES: cytochrome b/b6 domain-containing protein [unclassified Vibrio]|uniref:cytochrome b/b6 domain-containing protein n=1 Tax=unclassified Vibrio TaxID=2614977 RepID=UPI002552B5CF|nr:MULTISPECIES: cytochrome b/b6 domain-containing protein [unclassified Vibrio]
MENNKHNSRLSLNHVHISHWVLVLLVLTTLTIGFTLTKILEHNEKANLAFIHQLLGFHIIAVSLYLIMKVLRKNKLNITLATMVHIALPITLITIAVTGISMAVIGTPWSAAYTWLIPDLTAPKQQFVFLFSLHSNAIKILLMLVTLHLLGALKHHFIDKGDKVMKLIGKVS